MERGVRVLSEASVYQRRRKNALPLFSLTFSPFLFSTSFSSRCFFSGTMGREEEDYPGASSLSSSWRAASRASTRERERERKQIDARSSSTFAVEMTTFWRSPVLSAALSYPSPAFLRFEHVLSADQGKGTSHVSPSVAGEQQRSTKERKKWKINRREREASDSRLLFFSRSPSSSQKTPFKPNNRRGRGAPRERGIQDLEEEHAVSVW